MKSVVVALGCSFTVGHEIEEEFGNQNSDHYRAKYRYAEILRQKLGYSEHAVYGMCGGSNELAIRTAYPGILDYIHRGYKILVLFGMTSIWRTELYDVEAKEYVGFIYGNETFYTINPDLVPPSTKSFIRNYKIHTAEEEYQATKQAIDIVGFHSFLKTQGIEHVFFDIFEHSNTSSIMKVIPGRNHIWRDRPPLNMLVPTNLRASGYHPNVAGHRFIADTLHSYLINGNYNL